MFMTLSQIIALPSVKLSLVSTIPPIPAVYFCISGEEEVLYIGLAANLNVRWRQHHKALEVAGFSNVSIYWLELSEKNNGIELEREFIQHWQPLLNVRGNKTQKTIRIDEPPFIKLYPSEVYLLKGLKLSEMNTLFELNLRCDHENIIILTPYIIREISSELNTTVECIKNNIKTFIKHKILRKIKENEYFINPFLFSSVDWAATCKLQRYWHYLIFECSL